MVSFSIDLTQFPRAQGKQGKGGPANAVSEARSKPWAEYPANHVDHAGTRQIRIGSKLFRLDTAAEGDGHQAVSEVHLPLERRGTS